MVIQTGTIAAVSVPSRASPASCFRRSPRPHLIARTCVDRLRAVALHGAAPGVRSSPPDVDKHARLAYGKVIQNTFTTAKPAPWRADSRRPRGRLGMPTR